jgi:vacuolar-type H+-ATPase subunit F/Vma7
MKMAKVQQTLSITIDDTTFEVAGMSEQIKQMVELMDDWRQQESDVSGQLILVRSAIRDIQNSLLTQIRQDQEAAAAPAVVEVPAAPTGKKVKASKKA